MRKISINLRVREMIREPDSSKIKKIDAIPWSKEISKLYFTCTMKFNIRNLI